VQNLTETKQKYLVGFDRFIDIEWCEFALDLAAHPSMRKQDQIVKLKTYLSNFIDGHDGIRKTANVLTRLWLDTDMILSELKKEAIQIHKKGNSVDNVALHWGMSLAVFPLFKDTAVQVGRLCSIQQYFKRNEIHSRLLENYGNVGTLPRSVDRILQSMINWHILERVDIKKYACKSLTIADAEIEKWLIEVTINSSFHKRILFNDLFRLPELYPYRLNGEIRSLISQSKYIHLERDGNNLEYLSFR